MTRQALAPAVSPTAADHAAARAAMVVSQLRPNGVTDVRLVEAMGQVPREVFVPSGREAAAYIDRAIPFGPGRGLNPPLTTALLLNAAAIAPGDNVLIVGAGTGYAAVIATMLTDKVTALESDADLLERLRENVAGARTVEGTLASGAPEFAPFDAIVIDGAVEFVPDALVAQLTPQGRLTVALVENGVSRLAVGRRGGSGFACVSFVDAEAVSLPGFAKPREFVF